jgi:hypothetical protein
MGLGNGVTYGLCLLLEKHGKFDLKTLIAFLDYEEVCVKFLRNRGRQVIIHKCFPDSYGTSCFSPNSQAPTT